MIWIAILFTLLLVVESFWLFAWSAHVAPILEIGAPLFCMLSVLSLWTVYGFLKKRKIVHKKAVLLAAGFAVILMGAIVGSVAKAIYG